MCPNDTKQTVTRTSTRIPNLLRTQPKESRTNKNRTNFLFHFHSNYIQHINQVENSHNTQCKTNHNSNQNIKQSVSLGKRAWCVTNRGDGLVSEPGVGFPECMSRECPTTGTENPSLFTMYGECRSPRIVDLIKRPHCGSTDINTKLKCTADKDAGTQEDPEDDADRKKQQLENLTRTVLLQEQGMIRVFRRGDKG